jgi:hypothetical protein
MSNKPGEKSVYVVMPVSATASCTTEEWDDIFTGVFTPAFDRCGYRCHKTLPGVGSLMKSIVVHLQSSWLVLADLTDRNANVFYEVGVRHALSKRTILVAQREEDIPSDLRGYWWLVYGTKPGPVARFQQDIARMVKDIEADPDHSDNPVSDFLEHERLGVSSYLAKENVKKLSALFTELTGIINTLRQVELDPQYAEFLSPRCLDLLLSTLYVDVGPVMLASCYDLRHRIHVVQAGVARGDYVRVTRDLASDVLAKVIDLRMKMARGEFVEPRKVSVMVWAPGPAGGGEKCVYREYSTSAPLDDIDIEQLKSQLREPGAEDRVT